MTRFIGDAASLQRINAIRELLAAESRESSYTHIPRETLNQAIKDIRDAIDFYSTKTNLNDPHCEANKDKIARLTEELSILLKKLNMNTYQRLAHHLPVDDGTETDKGEAWPLDDDKEDEIDPEDLAFLESLEEEEDDEDSDEIEEAGDPVTDHQDNAETGAGRAADFLVRRKNKYIGAVLGLFFSYLSGFYISASGTFLLIALSALSLPVLFFFSIPVPSYFGYLLGLMFAAYNYRFISALNMTVDEDLTMADVSAQEFLVARREMKSGICVSYAMGAYNWFIGLYLLFGIGANIYLFFSTGHPWRGLLNLLFVPIILFSVYWCLRLVEGLLMTLFGAGQLYRQSRFERKIGFKRE